MRTTTRSASSEPEDRARSEAVDRAASTELSPAHFRWIRRVARTVAGLHLAPGKERVVRARLAKRLRATRSCDFTTYIERLQTDRSGRELWAMIDALAVHQTSFFREPAQFPHFQDVVGASVAHARPVRIWSAGCATGEEAFTLALLVHTLGTEAAATTRILATDLSRPALSIAREATYSGERVAGVPREFRNRFEPIRDGSAFRVNADVRSMVRIARHNLVGEWPMKGPFDVVFCRNVMIYFDRAAQRRLVDRFREILAPGGHLFIGHAEALPPETRFEWVQPAVYRKSGAGP